MKFPCSLPRLPGTPRQSDRIWISALTAILLAIPSISAKAQSSSAAVSGTVPDSSGAVIPDADVLLTNTDTHAQQKTRKRVGGDLFDHQYPSRQLFSARFQKYFRHAGEDRHCAAGESDGDARL
jgi:hypothetical protein